MDERWLLPHTTDFYVRSEDIRHVMWEPAEGEEADRFKVRITFTHPTIASKQWSLRRYQVFVVGSTAPMP